MDHAKDTANTTFSCRNAAKRKFWDHTMGGVVANREPGSYINVCIRIYIYLYEIDEVGLYSIHGWAFPARPWLWLPRCGVCVCVESLTRFKTSTCSLMILHYVWLKQELRELSFFLALSLLMRLPLCDCAMHCRFSKQTIQVKPKSPFFPRDGTVNQKSRGVRPSTTNLTQRSWVVEGEAWTDHPGVPAVSLL